MNSFYSSFRLDYLIKQNRWCEAKRQEKDNIELTNINHTRHTLEQAKNECTSEKTCKMFYDMESKNKNYVLCGVDTKFPTEILKSNVLSRLFVKCKGILQLYFILILYI